MRSRLTLLLSLAGAWLMVSASTAHAQASLSICKDGTRSSVVGRGACGGHGGVDPKATEAARKAAKTAKKAEEKSEPKAVKVAERKAEQAEKKAEKAEKKVEHAEAKAAMVKCKDGAMSKGGRGACSGHGGIAK